MNNFKTTIDDDLLHRLQVFYHRGDSVASISESLEISSGAIYNLIDTYKIRRKIKTSKPDTRYVPGSIDVSQIADMYYDQKLSQSQIASKLFVSRSRIQQIMKQYNIKSRSLASASSNMNDQRTIHFTPLQEQLIFGSMLGDAGLYYNEYLSNKTGQPYKSINLTFGHSTKFINYVHHKRSVLPGTEIGYRISGFGVKIAHYSFCHTPSLQKYVDICLDKEYKKKVNNDWIDRLNWIGIAYWYQDDGSLVISKNRPMIRFHTESFSDHERSLLQAMLADRFGLNTRLCPNNSNDQQLMIVSRHQQEAKLFLRQLQPYIQPIFKYKIRIIDEKPLSRQECLLNNETIT